MRVLLKEGAVEASAETILTVEPDLTETMLVTLSGEGVRAGGVVAEVDNWTVAEAIDAAAEMNAALSTGVDKTIEEVEWMAGVLTLYEPDSKIVQHLTATGCVIDTSKASRVSGSALTSHERRRAEEADKRGDYDSLASGLGRLGHTRDATAQGLEELRRRLETRPKDLLERENQLRLYDRELVHIRRHLLAFPAA